MSPDDTHTIPATPDISSAALEQRLSGGLSPKLLTTTPAYVLTLQPTSKQGVLGGLSELPKTPAATTPGVVGPAPPPTSEQRAPEGLMMETNRPKDDLDLMIEEALKMGDLVSHSQLFGGSNSYGSWVITRIGIC